MIRRTSFVTDTVFENRGNKTAALEEKDKRWLLIEEDGKSYLARVDEEENSEKKAKVASVYKDFDAYIKQVFPKEYASEYVADTESFDKDNKQLQKEIDSDNKPQKTQASSEVIKKFADTLKNDITNLQDLKTEDLAVLGKDIYASVIPEKDEKKEAAFIDQFVKA
jgi:hypothetical protein